MNKVMKNVGLLLSLCGLLLFTRLVAAEVSLCAEVVIEIKQELALERQAFEATMKVTNALDDLPLTSVKVEVLFTDKDNNPVVATSDTSNLDAAFFLRASSLLGVDSVDGNGTIAPATVAEIRWLIVPASGAADENPAGKLYYVGAVLTYTLNSEEQEVIVAPDTITVKPQPTLFLDYFLTKEVTADDAFTAEIEPPVPYTLGLRIANTGAGAAHSVTMDSSQPTIIENKQGLAIGFKITGSSVNDAAVKPSLLLNFGDIEPKDITTGRWIMETTLSGEFTKFSADFSHADEYGGQLTSLIDSANTHLLVRDVKVDLPNRDNVRDFLSTDGVGMTVYESEPSDLKTLFCEDCAEVADLSAAAVLTSARPLGDFEVRDLTHRESTDFNFIKVADPYQGQKALYQAVRDDGKVLDAANVWLSQQRSANKIDFDYFINVFDHNPTGKYELTFGEPVELPQPPVFIAVLPRTIEEGEQVGFVIQSSDPNGTVPQISLAQKPFGAVFRDRGDGKAEFTWLTKKGQAGTYPLTFAGSDGKLVGFVSTSITVKGEGDSDSDGMNDEWELEHFGDLSQGAQDDFDLDGIANIDDDEPAGSDISAANLQLASIQVEGTNKSLQFSNAYTKQPLVFMGMATGNNSQTVIPNISDVSAEGFDINLVTTDVNSALAVSEDLPYLAMLPGRYLSSGNFAWEAGVITLRKDAVTKSFSSAFAGTPKVFVSLQSQNNHKPVFTRVLQRSADGFEVQLETTEAENSISFAEEELAYIAIYEVTDEGQTQVNNLDSAYSLQEVLVNQDWSINTFTAMQLKEERTLDEEIDHVFENIDLLKINNQLFAQVASANELDPVIAVRDVDTDGDGDFNHIDTDDDNDGILDFVDAFPLDATESVDSDGDGRGDNGDAFPNDPSEWLDSDHDGMGDNYELLYGLDTTLDDSAADKDGDGLTNFEEFQLGINPTLIDSDGDGIDDKDETDRDNDGLDDAWEIQYFGHLRRDGTGDYDNDDYSDATEFANGTNPLEKSQAPGVPSLLSPIFGSEVSSINPTLEVQNGTHDSGMQVTYRFEIFKDASFTGLVALIPATSEGAASTSAVFDNASLVGDAIILDNASYFWRVRAEAKEGISEWIDSTFKINTVNDAPEGLVLVTPDVDTLVSTLTPSLSINNAVDVDGDVLTYQFEVQQAGLDIAQISGLQQGANNQTQWVLPTSLKENQQYQWRATVTDPFGASQTTMWRSFLVSTVNDAPTSPVISVPIIGAEVVDQLLSLTWVNAQDPEALDLTYDIQLDESASFDSANVQEIFGLIETDDTTHWNLLTSSDNQWMYWRVRASDGELNSEWVQGRFFLNTVNDAPSLPVIDNPGQEATVELMQPTLRVHPATDVDGDQLSYRFEVYADAGLQTLLHSQLSAEQQFVVPQALGDNKFYHWRIQAQDDEGLTSSWSETYRFFVNDGGVDDLPELTFVSPSTDLVLIDGQVEVQWTDLDPDSAAIISLFYVDQDGIERLLVENIAEDLDGINDSFTWNLAGLGQGIYQIKAVIEDGSSRVEVESSTTVTLLPDPSTLTITPIAGTNTDEAGITLASYSVVLDRAPLRGQQVTLNMSISDETEARILIDGVPRNYLQFTDLNWQQAQQVKIQGIDDCDVDGDQSYSLVLHSLVSGDAGYQGIDPADMALVNIDNEHPGQLQFICDYELVEQKTLADGSIEASYRALMLNQDDLSIGAKAKLTVFDGSMSLVGSNELHFPDIAKGVKEASYNTFTLTHSAGGFKPERLNWEINPGQGLGSNGLPVGWSNDDVGWPMKSGSAKYIDSKFKVDGGGFDIYWTNDGYHYAYTTLAGDGEIIAKVESLENTNKWAKAGLMMRESSWSGSKNAMALITPQQGTAFQYRKWTSWFTKGLPLQSGQPTHWLRLVRAGRVFTGYQSIDGESWNELGQYEISMDSQIQVGLAVTSHNNFTTAEAMFSRVQVIKH